MMMPMPMGTPMRLSAEVAGAMSRMQGLLQAAQPEIQSAMASHWLAARQAAAAPAFQDLTRQMMMGLYGTTALSGLLRYALSTRATPEVVGGIVDQVNLIQRSYQGATQALQQFLGDEAVQEQPGVQLMTRSLAPLDRFYQQMQGPGQMVLQGVNWAPSGPVPGFPVERSLLGFAGDQAPPPMTPPAPAQEPTGPAQAEAEPPLAPPPETE